MISRLIEACRPFKVRASCGHIVIRKMREATAGVPYTEETILEAPEGRACDECEDARARQIERRIMFESGFHHTDDIPDKFGNSDRYGSWEGNERRP